MLWLVITLIIVGILLLLLEVLVIPGTGITGIIGFATLIAGIWIAYKDLGVYEGNIVLGITVIVNILAVWLAIRSKTWQKAALHAKIDGKINQIENVDLKVGDRGVTISRCAPMGKAEFNNTFVEVDARTEFIDQDKEIEIVKIEGNKIFIKLINN
jgi:membrane-bound ClpP family serine protease